MKVNIIASTSGLGLWSEKKSKVTVTDLYIGYINNDDPEDDDFEKFGELRAYFDPNTWDINDGLIYTDPLWIKEFTKELTKLGFPRNFLNENLSYSEQGMQGRDYVSMDFWGDFYKIWLTIGGDAVES